MTIRNGIHFPAGTSVPSDEREKSRGAGAVTTYHLSEEELAKYQAMEKPEEKKFLWVDQGKESPKQKEEQKVIRPKHTKEEYLQLRAEGKNRTKIANEWGIQVVTLQNYLLTKWGIFKPELEDKALDDYLRSKYKPVTDAAPAESEPETEIKGLEYPVFSIQAYSGLRDTGMSQPEVARFFGMTLDDLKDRVKKERDRITREIAWSPPPILVDDTHTTENDPTDAKNDTTETENAAAGEPHAPTQEEREQAFEEQSPPVTAPHSSDLGETIVKSVFKAVAQSVYETAVSKGWHETPVPFPTAIALMHSELSEALEADRKQHGAEKVAEELADVIIRVMDTAEQEGLNLVDALFAKMAKNRERAWRHGGLKY